MTAPQPKPGNDPQPDADNEGVSAQEPAEGSDDMPPHQDGSPERE